MTAPADPWAKRFSQLWPTHIFERRLADHAEHDLAIADIVMEMDANKEDMTADYKGVAFLRRPEPAIAWLRDEINETLRGYLQYCRIAYQVDCSVQAWANVNRLGDYHGPHNHGWSYLSGTYYVVVPPSGLSASAEQKGMSPAAITFSDPRYGAYRHSIAVDPNEAARHTFHPEAGALLMWPSTLTHYVHPNHSDEPRISISFNVVLEWANQYAG